MQNKQEFMFSDVDKPIIWIDLEMSGLDIEKETILEIGVVVTDSDLKHKIIGPNIVLSCSEDILNRMDDWNQKHHTESGLLDAVKHSQYTIESAEQLVLEFLKQINVPYKNAPLAGNSIYTDKRFLQKYMPKLNDHLSSKLIDVTTFKHLCRRWNNKISQGRPKKKMTHRAIDDILESIQEMEYYKNNFIKMQTQQQQ